MSQNFDLEQGYFDLERHYNLPAADFARELLGSETHWIHLPKELANACQQIQTACRVLALVNEYPGHEKIIKEYIADNDPISVQMIKSVLNDLISDNKNYSEYEIKTPKLDVLDGFIDFANIKIAASAVAMLAIDDTCNVLCQTGQIDAIDNLNNYFDYIHTMPNIAFNYLGMCWDYKDAYIRYNDMQEEAAPRKLNNNRSWKHKTPGL
ncbi:MAG: hypothetical protein FWE93_00730 [Alphaproteobacteria bacterium]|nr:hypothetical protein [Alphaproteobacteria bacterium]